MFGSKKKPILNKNPIDKVCTDYDMLIESITGPYSKKLIRELNISEEDIQTIKESWNLAKNNKPVPLERQVDISRIFNTNANQINNITNRWKEIYEKHIEERDYTKEDIEKFEKITDTKNLQTVLSGGRESNILQNMVGFTELSGSIEGDSAQYRTPPLGKLVEMDDGDRGIINFDKTGANINAEIPLKYKSIAGISKGSQYIGATLHSGGIDLYKYSKASKKYIKLHSFDNTIKGFQEIDKYNLKFDNIDFIAMYNEKKTGIISISQSDNGVFTETPLEYSGFKFYKTSEGIQYIGAEKQNSIDRYLLDDTGTLNLLSSEKNYSSIKRSELNILQATIAGDADHKSEIGVVEFIDGKIVEKIPCEYKTIKNIWSSYNKNSHILKLIKHNGKQVIARKGIDKEYHFSDEFVNIRGDRDDKLLYLVQTQEDKDQDKWRLIKIEGDKIKLIDKDITIDQVESYGNGITLIEEIDFNKNGKKYTYDIELKRLEEVIEKKNDEK